MLCSHGFFRAAYDADGGLIGFINGTCVALGEPLTKASAWRFVRGFLASQGAHDEL